MNCKNWCYKTVAQNLGYSDRDRLVIVNIDDVGLHRDETEASFQAFDFGMVKTGSVMAPGPNFDHVVSLCRKRPELDLGVHLTLTCEWGERYAWRPVLPVSEVPSLYNPEGRMWESDEKFLLHGRKRDMECELEAQIQKVLDRGLKPSHLDHHMNIHQHPDYLSVVTELSRKYELPVYIPMRKRYKIPFLKNRLGSLRRQGFVFPDKHIGIYKMVGENLSRDFWKAQYHACLQSLKPGVHIFKVHIGFRTTDLENITGARDSAIRQIDFDVWTSEETRKLAEGLAIRFIGYRPLQELQRRLMKRA